MTFPEKPRRIKPEFKVLCFNSCDPLEVTFVGAPHDIGEMAEFGRVEKNYDDSFRVNHTLYVDSDYKPEEVIEWIKTYEDWRRENADPFKYWLALQTEPWFVFKEANETAYYIYFEASKDVADMLQAFGHVKPASSGDHGSDWFINVNLRLEFSTVCESLRSLESILKDRAKTKRLLSL